MSVSVPSGVLSHLWSRLRRAAQEGLGPWERSPTGRATRLLNPSNGDAVTEERNLNFYLI